MSVVIIGGHDRMNGRYREICKSHGCKCKVFTQNAVNLKEKIGCPDLVVLMTSTVAHKMVGVALSQAEKSGAEVARSHSSSSSALNKILKNFVSQS